MELTLDQINSAVGRALKGLVAESGLTQDQLASRAGMSLVTVQKLLSGNQGVKVPQFLAIARAAGFTAADAATRIDDAVAREEALMSQGIVSLDARRKKTPATMTDDELEQTPHAASTDDEHWQDEPDIP